MKLSKIKSPEKIKPLKADLVEQKKENLLESTQVIMVGPMPINQKQWKKFLKNKDEQSHFFIFVDGGSQHINQLTTEGNFSTQSLFYLSLGDGDSTPKKLDIKYKAEKNQTDFDLALKLTGAKLESIEFWGFHGGLFDHQLAVLGDLYHWIKTRYSEHSTLSPLGQIYCENEDVLFPIARSPHLDKSLEQSARPFDWIINFRHYGRFSVLSLEETTFNIKGHCRYQVVDELTTFPLSGRTISNWGGGEIEIKATNPFFIIIEKSNH